MILMAFLAGVWLGGAAVMWWLGDSLEAAGVTVKLTKYRSAALFVVALSWPWIIADVRRTPK